MKKHIPNFLTCLNLFCGCVAIDFLYQGSPESAAFLVILSAFFDLLDGMVARWLNVTSSIGKELDSLADMISFGFVPGVVLFMLMRQSDIGQWISDPMLAQCITCLPFVVTVFSGIRLAKFNIDTRQTTSFIGLPTPANTLWIIALPLILGNSPGEWDFLLRSAPVLIFLSILSAFLLVAELPLFSLKYSGGGLRGNAYQVLLLVVGAVLLLLFSIAALPIIIAFYVLLSIVKNFRTSTNEL